MTLRANQFGRIQVSQAAITALAADAVKQSYGVVGMSSRNRLDELTGPLQRAHQRGVEIREEADGLVVDLYIIVEYGIRISEVASGVMRRVYYTLKESAGLPVQAVNVHVQGLRVNDSGSAKPH
ncbi:MAG: Asp23/Gls24 family envelope stress response protein [Caldilineales bacterium]